MFFCTVCRFYCRISPFRSICESCDDSLSFNDYIAEELYEYGKRTGYEVGITEGIRHTVYKTGFDLSGSTHVWVPSHAYMDRLAFTEGYEFGFITGYKTTYEKHKTVIEQLKNKHLKKNCILSVHKVYRNNKIFEPCVVRQILQFIN